VKPVLEQLNAEVVKREINRGQRRTIRTFLKGLSQNRLIQVVKLKFIERNLCMKTRARLNAAACALALVAFTLPARADDNEHPRRRVPELPLPVCDRVNVPEGNRLSAHVYASGVQIYRWGGTNWVFVAPEAALFVDSCYERQVGIHYAGPTWEANDGSKVVAARIDGCTPERGAIPWLLLGATSTTGRGEFGRVTFIQRVNTIGGTAPAEAGAFVGDEARVPYTTEYYFYRAAKN
jgi:hypothetical protein